MLNASIVLESLPTQNIRQLGKMISPPLADGNAHQTITKMVLSANLAQRTNVDLGSIVVRHARRPQIPLA